MTTIPSWSAPMLGGFREIDELRQRQTRAVALGLAVAAFVAMVAFLPGPPKNLTPSLLCMLLFLGSALIWNVSEARPTVGRWGILLAPLLCLALALWLAPGPVVVYLPAALVVANGAIDSKQGFGAAALSSLLLILLVSDPTLRIAALALLWLVTIMTWISARGFFTALAWSEYSQQHASSLLHTLRTRQGELNRTLDALTEATRRLQRTNQELHIARREAEEARLLKEQFVANVSHELRTPLNLIVGFAEMMYLSPENYDGAVWTPDLESDVRELYRASRHLESLVSDILDLSRIDAARLPMFRESLDLCAVVADAVETIRPLLRQRGLDCALHASDDLPRLFIDRTRIRQVMLNLLNNAVRFTDAGTLDVEITADESCATVKVSDTGIGIPQDQLDRIFEEFRQVDSGLRRRGGAGLGLALSRRFVELHGGRMWAESQVGVGSTFSFSLPFPGALPQTTNLQRSSAAKAGDRSRMPIVIVDPDPTVASMLSRYLGDHPALPAADMAEAERLIEAEHPLGIIVNDSPTDPGVVEADAPPSQANNVPVIRCSIPSPSWLVGANGLDGCLTKPVTRAALAQDVERHCPPNGTVLIVDDDPAFVTLMVRMLGTLAGSRRVLRAYSGTQALQHIGNVAPDLVLLDLRMPDVDGYAVLRAIRSEPRCHGTAVVAVTATGYADEALRNRGSTITITQSGGIPVGALTEILNGVFRIVRPDYATGDNASSSA